MHAVQERTKEINPKDLIAGLEKGLKIIEAFDDMSQRLSPSTAARRTGLHRSAARRHLLTLEHLGYLESDGHMFWLTPRVLRLGWSYVESAKVPRIVQPFLVRISQALSAESYFSVLDGDDLVVVGRSGYMQEHNSHVMLGSRVSPRLHSAGLMLISTLPDDRIESWLSNDGPYYALTPFTYTNPDDIRRKILDVRLHGHCLLEQQIETGTRSISVLVRNRESMIVGALSITVKIGTQDVYETRQEVVPILNSAAALIQAVL
ncbi:IclR family transcriptional regulator C-terminal domain-containing protein [Limnobacter sp.]|uniref:IclR family transcriptional regulator domain-containing protein n=1 Tax=Limnobacter sp. TaxID=2003368 RepID=UPI0025C4BD62|nr:IclR family transcriptional regulator C-terminal domain-containing protein [Limnobacter sp.]